MDELIVRAGRHLRSRVLTNVEYQGHFLPIKACYFGSERPDVPVLAFVGGVHGIERIGSQVVLAFMETLVKRLEWDDSLIRGLEHLRLLFIPVLNPVGLIRKSRANGAGVDLMRNAPVDADTSVPFLVGGQRLSARLPWYRGRRNAPMQPESAALCEAINAELANAPFVLSVDVHSGYGVKDQLWFPLACSYQPVENLPEIYSLFELLQDTYPNLNYLIEPQSHQYLTHGDLWDHLYLTSREGAAVFLPLTLEMGSWNWVRKNWRQTGSFAGWFNPVKPHRIQRVLRRHTVLFEFLLRATRAYGNWLPGELSREKCRQKALQMWYNARERNDQGDGEMRREPRSGNSVEE